MEINLGTESVVSHKDSSRKCLDETITYKCQMEFPILINWKSPFPFSGVLGIFFSFWIEIDKSKQCEAWPGVYTTFFMLNSTEQERVRALRGYFGPL